MKKFYRTRSGRLLCMGSFALTLAITAYCRRSDANNTYPHLAILRHSGEVLYIDSIDSRVAMDDMPDSPLAHLSSFLIGWSDDLAAGDEPGLLQRDLYFHRQIQHDWVALSGGDSIYPLRFRERPLLDRHLRQGAIVFLAPPGHRIDTLVYTGTEAPWAKKLFVLKRK